MTNGERGNPWRFFDSTLRSFLIVSCIESVLVRWMSRNGAVIKRLARHEVAQVYKSASRNDIDVEHPIGAINRNFGIRKKKMRYIGSITIFNVPQRKLFYGQVFAQQ